MDDGGNDVDSAEDGDPCDASCPLLMSPSKLASNCFNSASARSSRVNVRGCDTPAFSGAGCVSNDEMICASFLVGEDELHHQPILCELILMSGNKGKNHRWRWLQCWSDNSVDYGISAVNFIITENDNTRSTYPGQMRNTAVPGCIIRAPTSYS